ncbi:hypothetical protein LJB83_02155, partial [Clostridia bacterium OttesenSCG-928-F22]|nr:hypothetical protein [Clostridia bacterium OttesenSCG-928-F22]
LDWIKWLEDYLPKRYKIAKGIVIDSNGKESDQIDAIIYDPQYSYLVMHHKETLLIPAESVYAVFEVKQSLNKGNIEYAGKKAKSVRELYRTSIPIKHAGGHHPARALSDHDIIAGILTTRADWKKPIFEKAIEHIDNRKGLETLDLVCSLEENTFVMDYKEDYDTAPEISYCNGEASLVYLLVNMIKKLQFIGTVAAIDLNRYAAVIESQKRGRR